MFKVQCSRGFARSHIANERSPLNIEFPSQFDNRIFVKIFDKNSIVNVQRLRSLTMCKRAKALGH